LTEELHVRGTENRENSDVHNGKTGGSNEVKLEIPKRFIGG